tara:strand:+ start:68 stop:496 length:429 start_codon:yes stop_codon:yes gene_type:complete
MNRLILLSVLAIFSLKLSAQTAKDVNLVIQRMLDFSDLQKVYTEEEKNGEVPLIILTNGEIPQNLLVFKFNKRVKIMTPQELETFKTMYKGSLDSYFVFDTLQFNGNEAKIYARFRKNDNIPVHLSLKKENNNWVVVEGKAG